MDTVIEARGLVKHSHGRRIIDELHFQIYQGECFGVLGPEGSGKTSLIELLSCHSSISSGGLFVLGMNVESYAKRIKARIGVVPQGDGLEKNLSVEENLLVYARYFGIPQRRTKIRLQELLRFVHLEDYEDYPVEKLDAGMKRRLVLARALISRPDILLLDEPGAHLPQDAKMSIWKSIHHLKSQGMTIILTTRNMREAERLCDRVLLINKGKAIATGDPANLVSKHVGTKVIEFGIHEADLSYYINKIKDEYKYQIFQNKIRLYFQTEPQLKKGLGVITSDNITVRSACLDDVFLRMVGVNVA